MNLICMSWLSGAGTAKLALPKRAVIGAESDAGIVTAERDCANHWDFAC